MDVDLPEVHARALDSTRDFVAPRVSDAQWELSSRCAEWTVFALVQHVVSGNLWAGELLAGKTIEEVGTIYDGDLLGDDPLDAYDLSAAIARSAFRVPGAMDVPVAVSYGPVPGSVYCGHRFFDVLIHGWDVAVSSGQDPALDPELVEACWVVLEPQLAPLQASGMFGTPIDVPAGADRQTELLAVLGRTT